MTLQTQVHSLLARQKQSADRIAARKPELAQTRTVVVARRTSPSLGKWRQRTARSRLQSRIPSEAQENDGAGEDNAPAQVVRFNWTLPAYDTVNIQASEDLVTCVLNQATTSHGMFKSLARSRAKYLLLQGRAERRPDEQIQRSDTALNERGEADNPEPTDIDPEVDSKAAKVAREREEARLRSKKQTNQKYVSKFRMLLRGSLPDGYRAAKPENDVGFVY
ncbi:hypothetical protein AURDEDRAFT_132038 [Auricularia subglabra TFB-10046 SS5]|uniref:Uncharacterized protein n=1 Tax=Auricularia subglabra (strain TFB-10046 / SS5) TaxID=717982 RepID=J0L8K8_AURST|nr:hypothetical protein AURDEDRAFT_132038 [Auricularia subglabra TFB-10046 SS5]